MVKPTAIDLFAGCGGLTQGLRDAGYRVIGAVENDSLAIETYRSNHPRVRTWCVDIRKLPAARVLRELCIKPGELDVLAGCPPCQGFSSITSLNGRYRRRDGRNDLVFEWLRFVRVLRPKAVMMENVPGLSKDRRIESIRKALKRLGYKVRDSVLDAADYGVPQRRRRFVLLGASHEEPRFAPKSRRRVTVRQAFSRLSVSARRDALHLLSETRSKRIRSLIRQIPRDGGSRSALQTRYQLECHRATDGFKDVYGRMAWGDVAPTITGGCCNPSKGRFLHPSRNRCITLREAAVLQSFPASYYFSLRRGKFAVAQMIGNALPPEFVRRLAKTLSGSFRGVAGQWR